jgi:hypothetical protein
MSALEGQLMKDIDNIWNSLIRPDEFKDSTATDFFDFEFVGLPHKVYREKEFCEAVDQLRERFVNPESSNYLYQPQYKKNVPIDGFQYYAYNIWQTILSNKDLDLPTQKEMLAMYRCGEISNEVFVPFEESCKLWEESVRKKKIVTRLGTVAKTEAEIVLDSYNQQTSLYAPGVVELKRIELLDRMKAAVHDVYRSQLLLIRENAVQAFKKLLGQVVRRDTVLLDFLATVEKIKDEILSFFDAKASEAVYPGEEWDCSQYREQLTDEVNRHIQDERTHQIRILTDNEKQLLADNMKSGLSDILRSPSADFWKVTRSFLQEKLDELRDHLQEQLQGFNADENEMEGVLDVLKAHARVVLHGYIEGYVNQLTLRMNNRYDEIFKFNGQVARTWRSVDEIQRVHNQAAQGALSLLDIFFLNRLEHPEYDHIHLRIPSQEQIGDEFKFPDKREVIDTATKYGAPRRRSNKRISQDNDEEDESQSVTTPQVEELRIEEEFNANLLIDKNTCSRMHTDFIVRIHSNLQSTQDRFLMLSNNQSIPWWMFIVLLVLGWDELMYFLKKPFYLLLFIIVGAFFFWGYLRNQMQDYLDNGNNEMVKIVLRIVLDRMDSFTHSAVGSQLQQFQQAATQQIANTTSTGSSSPTISSPLLRVDTTHTEGKSPVPSPSSPNSGEKIFDGASSGEVSPTSSDLRKRSKPVLQKGMSRGSVMFSSGVDSKALKDLQSKLTSEMNLE